MVRSNKNLQNLNDQLSYREIELAKLLASVEQQRQEVTQAKDAADLRSKQLDMARRGTMNMLRDMEESQLKADAATRAKSDFLANVSHEIRTPMTAILGFSEIIRDNSQDREQIEAIDTIQRNGSHLLGIINDILDLSKVEAGQMTLERITCSPQEIVSDVIELMQVRADSKGISLMAKQHGPLPENIQSDPIRLRRILINVIGNAIKFTEVGSVLVTSQLITDAEEGPTLSFDVTDTGIGLSGQKISQLFQPFVQADTSTSRKFGGTGLGLTISKRMAELLGGDISVTSSPGTGSTFRVTVGTGPLNNMRMMDSTTKVDTKNPKFPKTEAPEKANLDCWVLLAEDRPDNQRLISFVLKKAGADVSVAENGQIALDLALNARDQGTPFDVILMDMQMPVLDGYQATTKLRENNYQGPILALTTHAMTSDRQKCLDAGCDGYATKPIDRKELISVVAQFASKPTPAEC
ncbi:MAG: ATP-binding protein [Pirellulales bacterium]